MDCNENILNLKHGFDKIDSDILCGKLNVINFRQEILEKSLAKLKEYTFDLSFRLEDEVVKPNVNRIHTDSFKYLTSLRKLALRTEMCQLDHKLFSRLVHLEHFDSIFNRVDVLKSHCFSGLKHLKKLNLSYCGIQTIEDEAMHGLSR